MADASDAREAPQYGEQLRGPHHGADAADRLAEAHH